MHLAQISCRLIFLYLVEIYVVWCWLFKGGVWPFGLVQPHPAVDHAPGLQPDNALQPAPTMTAFLEPVSWQLCSDLPQNGYFVNIRSVSLISPIYLVGKDPVRASVVCRFHAVNCVGWILCLAAISCAVLSPRSPAVALNLSENRRLFIICKSILQVWIHPGWLPGFTGPPRAQSPAHRALSITSHLQVAWLWLFRAPEGLPELLRIILFPAKLCCRRAILHKSLSGSNAHPVLWRHYHRFANC